MIKGTNPTIELTIKSHDLRNCTIIVTFSTKANKIEKNQNQITTVFSEGNTLLLVPFTQSESLRLSSGEAEVQVNWVDENGARKATEIKVIDIKRNLHERVIPSE